MQPGEDEHLEEIIAAFTAQMRGLWNPGHFERGGNTKTHGDRAGRVHRPRRPARAHAARHLRRADAPTAPGCGSRARARTCTPDIDDVGFMSMSIKLMDVAGPKLLDDEKLTQDMLGVSTPTFVTPRHARQRPAPALEPQERADLLLRATSGSRTSSTRSCSCSGRRRRRARSRASTSAACPTCWAKVRRCSTRSARGSRREPAYRACRFVRPTTTSVTRWSRRSRSEDVEFDVLRAAADRSVPDADRERRGAVADEALAARPGGRAAHSEADASTRPSSSRSRGCSRTTRGTASPSTARSATRAGPGSGCTASCRRLRQQMNAVEHYEPTGDEVFP